MKPKDGVLNLAFIYSGLQESIYADHDSDESVIEELEGLEG